MATFDIGACRISEFSANKGRYEPTCDVETLASNKMHRHGEYNDDQLNYNGVTNSFVTGSRYTIGRPYKAHYIGGIRSPLVPSSWEREMECFEQNDMIQFIRSGVSFGFPIVDNDVEIDHYVCDNYNSAKYGPANKFITDLFKQELEEGKLIETNEIPTCVHAIGAVSKKDGQFRPIIDCKRPVGRSINEHMKTTWEEFSYESLDNVTACLKQGNYLSTVDIRSAYRSVPVLPEHWKYLGMKWNVDGEEKTLLDTRICFGLKCAPYIFSCLSGFIVQCMRIRGFERTFCYLDDFILIGDTFDQCQQAQLTLIHLLGDLGFATNWKKCTSPSKNCIYLGVQIDTQLMQLRLPKEKLNKLHTELKFFEGKPRATKRQLQRLVGILSHCGKVIRGSRTFSRRIIDLLRGLPDKNVRIKLSTEFEKDILWWRSFSKHFNGVSCIIQETVGGLILHSDASLSGYGFVHNTDWGAGFFNTSEEPEDICECDPSHGHWANISIPYEYCDNINVLEIVPILIAVNKYGYTWRNQKICWFTDNLQVVNMVNKGTSINDYCMEVLRCIFWCSVVFNFHIICKHIAGSDNIIPDQLSRIKGVGSIFSNGFSLCCSTPSGVG